jgi:hypothetical protein
MPARIPINAAKKVAKEHNCQQVVILAYDGKLQHCVTYGTTVESCAQAAHVGNTIKTALGWPSNTMAEPSRVRALKSRIKELEGLLSSYRLNGVRGPQI